MAHERGHVDLPDDDTVDLTDTADLVDPGVIIDATRFAPDGTPLDLGLNFDDIIDTYLPGVGTVTVGGEPIVNPVADTGAAMPPLVEHDTGQLDASGVPIIVYTPPPGHEWATDNRDDLTIRPIQPTSPTLFTNLTPEQQTEMAAVLDRAFGGFTVDWDPVTQTGSRDIYDQSGTRIGGADVADPLGETYNTWKADQANPTKQAGVWDAIKRVWGGLGEGTKAGLIGAVTSLGLGGIGLAISRGVAPGGATVTLPPPPGVSTVQAGTQGVMNTVLNTVPGGGTTTGTVAPPGAGTTVVPGAPGADVPAGTVPGGTGTLPNPFALTGNQNLDQIFRSSLAGQSILSTLAALQAAREFNTTGQMAPYEDALRALAMSQIPAFMTPMTPGQVASTVDWSQTPWAGTGVGGGAAGTGAGGAGTGTGAAAATTPPPGAPAIPADVASRAQAIDHLISLKQTPSPEPALENARQQALATLQARRDELLAPYAATTTTTVSGAGGVGAAGTDGASGPGAGQSVTGGRSDIPPDLAAFLASLQGANPNATGTQFTDWLMRALDPNAPDLPRQIDPIRLEIAAEVSRALRGETPSPLLDTLARQETEAERNRLFARLGAGFETSSPGIESLARLRDSQAMRAEQNRQQTFATLMPQEFARRQAEFANPLAAVTTLGAGEMDRARFDVGNRQSGLAERLALLNMGRQNPAQLASTLAQYVPIQALLGLDATNASNLAAFNQANAAAVANANAANQGDATTTAAIMGLLGNAAAAFRPSYNIVWPGATAATGGR